MRSSQTRFHHSVLTEPNELVLLRALVRASDVGVLLSDPDRADLICNDAFCRMFGIEGIDDLSLGETFIRERIATRIRDGEHFLKTLAEAYADPAASFEDEIEMIGPRHRWIRRSTNPVSDDDGVPIGRLWTFVDISRIRRLEERVARQASQLKEQARQLASDLRTVSGRLIRAENELTQAQLRVIESERMRAAGLLGASVAHNIRNILTPLKIELTLAVSGNEQQRGESFEVMQRQVDRLSLLTHRLLAIARPEHAEQTEVDLCTLVCHVAEILATHAAQENVRIETACSRRTPFIMGDQVQLDQMVVNLALNGIQAMHQLGAGTLTISVRPSRSGVALQVSDTGPGIPVATRRRLFDPFFSTRPDGTGLGLYSCRRIVMAHGGRIAIRSVLGQGTRVTIWLPTQGAPHAGEDTAR